MANEPTTNMITQNLGSPTMGESAASVPAEGEKPQSAMSPQFAALARKERQLRQMSRTFQAEKQAFEAQKAEVEKYKGWESKLANDPIGVMLEKGFTTDEIAQRLLSQNDPNQFQFQKLQQKIQDLESAQVSSMKKIEDTQSANYQQARKQITNDVKMLVDGNESYESIQAMGAQSAVVELIEQVFNKDGYLMSLEDAAKEVEEYCLEQAKKIAGLKKLQQKSEQVQNPAGFKQPQSGMKTELQAQTQANTLSNRGLSTSRPLNEGERRERAIALLEGRLPPN